MKSSDPVRGPEESGPPFSPRVVARHRFPRPLAPRASGGGAAALGRRVAFWPSPAAGKRTGGRCRAVALQAARGPALLPQTRTPSRGYSKGQQRLEGWKTGGYSKGWSLRPALAVACRLAAAFRDAMAVLWARGRLDQGGREGGREGGKRDHTTQQATATFAHHKANLPRPRITRTARRPLPDSRRRVRARACLCLCACVCLCVFVCVCGRARARARVRVARTC